MPQRTAAPCAVGGAPAARHDASTNKPTQATATAIPTASDGDRTKPAESAFAMASTLMKLFETSSEYACAK